MITSALRVHGSTTYQKHRQCLPRSTQGRNANGSEVQLLRGKDRGWNNLRPRGHISWILLHFDLWILTTRKSYGETYHKECYLRMLKEAKSVNDDEDNSSYLSEILETLVSIGGKADSIDNVARRLHPDGNIDKQTIIELSRNVEELRAYDFLTGKNTGQKEYIVIMEAGKRLVASDRRFK